MKATAVFFAVAILFSGSVLGIAAEDAPACPCCKSGSDDGVVQWYVAEHLKDEAARPSGGIAVDCGNFKYRVRAEIREFQGFLDQYESTPIDDTDRDIIRDRQEQYRQAVYGDLDPGVAAQDQLMRRTAALLAGARQSANGRESGAKIQPYAAAAQQLKEASGDDLRQKSDGLFENASAGGKSAPGSASRLGTGESPGPQGGDISDQTQARYLHEADHVGVPAVGDVAGRGHRLGPGEPGYDDQELRGPMVRRLDQNPIGREFAEPMFSRDPKMKIEVNEVRDDWWARYSPDSHLFELNRRLVNDDIRQVDAAHSADTRWRAVGPVESGRPFTERQKEFIADRYMPLVVHEVGGHGRHLTDLEEKLGHPSIPTADTEVDAHRLEAMSILAERQKPGRADYLSDGTRYGKDKSHIVDRLEQSRAQQDPQSFTDWVHMRCDGYRKMGFAAAQSEAQKAQLQALGAKQQTACRTDLKSTRCQDALDALEAVASPEASASLQIARQLCESGPCRPKDRRMFADVIADEEKLAQARQRDAQRIAEYYRGEDEKMAQAARQFLAPPKAPTPKPMSPEDKALVADLERDAARIDAEGRQPRAAAANANGILLRSPQGAPSPASP